MRLWGGLAVCWLVLALAGWAVAALAPVARGDGRIPAGLAAGGAGAPGGGRSASPARWRRCGSARDPRWVARRIEARHPELGTELLAAVEEVEAAPAPARLGYLQATVVREALEHRRSHDWDETVPTWLLRSAKLAHAACLAVPGRA